jgi:hypothetical protein
LSALEAGRTENPTAQALVRFADFFGMSIDTLFRVDLSKISELSLRELEAGHDVYMKGTSLRVLSISTDNGNRKNVEYVPVKAKAGYRAGYADPDFIASLPKFSMPHLPSSGTFRMFPTTGDSMVPIPEGAEIVCRFVDDWTSLKPATLCILILNAEQDFVFKSVTVNSDDRTLWLESLNSSYEPYEVGAGDVLEIWMFLAIIQKKFLSERQIYSIFHLR